jgi:hypothetical protein
MWWLPDDRLVSEGVGGSSRYGSSCVGEYEGASCGSAGSGLVIIEESGSAVGDSICRVGEGLREDVGESQYGCCIEF